jgi:hypothetical protein
MSDHNKKLLVFCEIPEDWPNVHLMLEESDSPDGPRSPFLSMQMPTPSGIFRAKCAENARGPRAEELRAEIEEVWRKLAASGIPERERTAKIAKRLSTPLSTIDYHIRQLGLRKKRKT